MPLFQIMIKSIKRFHTRNMLYMNHFATALLHLALTIEGHLSINLKMNNA